jgi:hypothetical protein
MQVLKGRDLLSRLVATLNHGHVSKYELCFEWAKNLVRWVKSSGS